MVIGQGWEVFVRDRVGVRDKVDNQMGQKQEVIYL